MDWEQFRIDPVWDNDGTKQRKLEGFMNAMLDEKKKATNMPTKKAASKKKNAKKVT